MGSTSVWGRRSRASRVRSPSPHWSGVILRCGYSSIRLSIRRTSSSAGWPPCRSLSDERGTANGRSPRNRTGTAMTSHEPPDPLHRAERLVGELVVGAERLADRVAPPEERDLVRRALDLSARKKLLLARRLWRDARVRRLTRMPIILGTLYMLLPIRLIPMRF